MFDHPRPQPRALWVANRCFSKLREKGIPVFAITGNHDSLMRRGAMPPHVLFSQVGLRLITEAEPSYVHKGVFISGSPYISKYYSGRLKETLAILSRQASRHKKSILVLHQGIDKYLPYDFELKMGEIPKNFDYYAIGHMHFHIEQNYGRGKLACPGSTEFWSINEYEDYKKNGKGFYLVDLAGDEPSVQHVNVELGREVLLERVDPGKLEEQLTVLKKRFAGMGAKPLVYLDVDSSGYDRKVLHSKFTSLLSDLALSLRVSYAPALEKGAAPVLTRSFNIPEMIRQRIKNEKKARLAIQLFDSLSAGDEEQSLEIAADFFRDTGLPKSG
jgi:exonuclease SbcD